MNFVAHYYLDRHRPESEFAVGVATPDLMSIYNAALRVKYNQITSLKDEVFEGEHGTFVSGVVRHFDADRIFHTSDFFYEETKWLSNKFTTEGRGIEVPRKFFVAHVLLELIMDKVLIREHPGILDEYYAHFDNADPLEIKASTEFLVGHELPNYESFLRKFRENEYLFNYTEWNHILFVLKRILKRVNIAEEAFITSPHFLAILEDFEQRLTIEYHRVFGDIVSQTA